MLTLQKVVKRCLENRLAEAHRFTAMALGWENGYFRVADSSIRAMCSTVRKKKDASGKLT